MRYLKIRSGLIHLNLLIRILLVLITVVLFFLTNCTRESDTSLAPYEGHRPLTFLKVTQSYTPDIQWVGGRVAAVGVNRGNNASLDSSLVWLMTAEDNSIESYVTVGTYTDTVTIQQIGGTPQDSLLNGSKYTFWLAEKEMLDVELDSIYGDGYNFTDTTFKINLGINGLTKGEKSGDELIVTINLIQIKTITETRFIWDWTPDSIAFRQIAIRKGKKLAGWSDLEWHILTPDSLEDNIYPPVVLGAQIEGTDEVIPWSVNGFEKNKTYCVWMSNSKWTSDNFGMNAYGLAFFIFRY